MIYTGEEVKELLKRERKSDKLDSMIDETGKTICEQDIDCNRIYDVEEETSHLFKVKMV